MKGICTLSDKQRAVCHKISTAGFDITCLLDTHLDEGTKHTFVYAHANEQHAYFFTGLLGELAGFKEKDDKLFLLGDFNCVENVTLDRSPLSKDCQRYVMFLICVIFGENVFLSNRISHISATTILLGLV